MDENFRKCKSKLMREFYLKVSLLSLSLGLVTGGLLIGLSRLLEWNFAFYYSILIGAVVALALFLVLFFVKKPNDEKIAERIDKEFELKEKVTSMVAFEGQEGILYVKQREDAKIQLSKKDPKKLPVRLAIINITALVFGASLFTASFFTPVLEHAENPGGGDNVPDKDTINDKADEIRDQIQDLINNSNASEELKAELNQILADLIEELEDDTDIQSRMRKVIKAEQKVDIALDKANSKEEIGEALSKVENDLLSKLGEAILNGDQDKVAEILGQLESHFAPRSVYTEDKLLDHLANLVETITNALDEAFVSTSDNLFRSMNHLTESFTNIEKKYSKYLSGDTKNGIDEAQAKADSITAIEKAIQEINACLASQAENSTLAENVKKYMESLINPSDGNGGGESGNNQTTDKDGETGENGSDGNGNGSGTDGEAGDDSQGGNESGDDSDDKGDDSGDNNGDSDQNGDGDQSGSGNGEGDNQGSSGEGGKGDGQSDSSSGSDSDSAGGGSGKTNYPSDDKVYTDENGYSSYGDVVAGSRNDANEDSKESGDSELDGILDDYFDSLYGSDSKTNP